MCPILLLSSTILLTCQVVLDNSLSIPSIVCATPGGKSYMLNKLPNPSRYHHYSNRKLFPLCLLIQNFCTCCITITHINWLWYTLVVVLTYQIHRKCKTLRATAGIASQLHLSGWCLRRLEVVGLLNEKKSLYNMKVEVFSSREFGIGGGDDLGISTSRILSE